MHSDSSAWWREISPDADWSLYESGGYVLLEGRVAGERAVVILDDHPQSRLRLRDIDDAELRQVLALPKSSHKSGRKAGRFEVAGRVEKRNLRVVYKWVAECAFEIITAFWE
jgi:hypothetical protein